MALEKVGFEPNMANIHKFEEKKDFFKNVCEKVNTFCISCFLILKLICWAAFNFVKNPFSFIKKIRADIREFNKELDEMRKSIDKYEAQLKAREEFVAAVTPIACILLPFVTMGLIKLKRFIALKDCAIISVVTGAYASMGGKVARICSLASVSFCTGFIGALSFDGTMPGILVGVTSAAVSHLTTRVVSKIFVVLFNKLARPAEFAAQGSVKIMP